MHSFLHTFKYALTAFILCSTLSCSSQDEAPLEVPASVEESETRYNYLALGDSYTIGEGVEEALRWPNQLIELLRAEEIEIPESRIIAKTGWTTRQLINAIENEDLSKFNLVSLLIGVNNQYQKLPFQTFQTEFNQLLETSIEISGDKRRVFVVSIPDYGVTPFGSANSIKIGDELDRYNAYIEEQCQLNSISFINITQISRELGASEGALAPDNLHPSGTQYSAWVDKILPVVVDLLKK